MQMVEEGEKMKYEITVSKTVSIPKDLGHQRDWRTCHSRHGILDASRKFHRKILGCAGLLIGCHSIPL
jgi:hypothetical protein